MPRQPQFKAAQLSAQIDYFVNHAGLPADRRQGGKLKGKPRPFGLPRAGDNLFSGIESDAETYMRDNGVQWHDMRAHVLSSQVCCLNFLMPFSRKPKALADLMRPVFGADIEVLPIEPDRYVAFEYIGGDYLNESGGKARKRGAGCTSADAAVKLRTVHGETIVLIEWKYTESYGAPIRDAESPKRAARYGAHFTDGPVRDDLGLKLEDFYYEPFYQLMRQQMLAHCMEGKEADRVSVLHISPRANRKLHAVTSPALRQFGDDAFAVWPILLRQPDRFASVAIEDLFGRYQPSSADGLADWKAYVSERYSFSSSP